MMTIDSTDDPFPALRQAVAQQAARVASAHAALFTTATHDLYDIFLEALDHTLCQIYTCHACRAFVERYGGLVTLDAQGLAMSAVWPEASDVPPPFQNVVTYLRELTHRAPVTGVFLSPLAVLGLPESPPTSAGHVWVHLAVEVPSVMRYHGATLTAGQAMAEKREDFRLLMDAVAHYPQAIVAQAHAFLASEQLYRAEHVLGVATWLLALHDALATVKHLQRRDNLLWHAVASAPPGWCHIGSTMIGTLLDDLLAGLDFADCQRKFASKMHPLQYQRPQAAPSEGALDRAEKLVAQLGVARSLERRFATLEDIQEFVWRPEGAVAAPASGAVFGHLRTAQKPGGLIAIDGAFMTWVKFRKTVLPYVDVIACWTPAHGPYAALTTAVYADAPPLLQWDTLDQRNAVAWYFYHGGSRPDAWNLRAGVWQSVCGIILQPTMWGGDTDRFARHGKGIFVLLEGARDMHRLPGNGIALFPETLKHEYREIRSVIEAYSRHGTLEVPETPPACGLGYKQGASWDIRLRVGARGMQTVYTLDRWD